MSPLEKGVTTVAKKTEAEALLAKIPEGGYAVSPSGSTKIVRGSGEAAEGFLWISGKTEAPADEEGLLKRLMKISPKVVEGWKVVGPDEVAEDLAERTAKDEEVRERVGLNKAAKAQEEAKKNGAATSRRSTKEPISVPKGFTVGTGADAEVGDQIITDESPERIVSIGSGGISRGRAYLKLMLEPPKGKLGSGEARRRFISPRKEYPIKKAKKAEAEKTDAA